MEQKPKAKKTLNLKKLIPIDDLSDSGSESEEDLIDFNTILNNSKKPKNDKQQPKPILQKRQRTDSEESKGSHKSKSKKNDGNFSDIEVDFELVQPCEPYYHGIRNLLVQYLDGEQQTQLDISGLADIIVNWISIGNVVASSLEEDPADMSQYKDLPDQEFEKIALKYNAEREIYGFTTILSLTKRQKLNKCFQQIIKYVLTKAKDHCNSSQLQTLENALNKKNVGLLLNERFINLPLNIVPKLHQTLPEDIKFTKKQDDIEDPREFDYEYLLVITRFTMESERQVKGEKRQKVQERLYYKYEDEIFQKGAEVSFAFKAMQKEVMEDGSSQFFTGGKGGKEIQYKMIYLIKYSEYEKRLKEL